VVGGSGVWGADPPPLPPQLAKNRAIRRANEILFTAYLEPDLLFVVLARH
jgi:hypothetical protein